MKRTTTCPDLLVALVAVAALVGTPARAAEKYRIDEKGGGKLYTTTVKVDVLVAPSKGSKVDYSYDPGAIMSVIGEATGTGYLYVNPCRACNNGFVSKKEFLTKAKRP